MTGPSPALPQAQNGCPTPGRPSAGVWPHPVLRQVHVTWGRATLWVPPKPAGTPTRAGTQTPLLSRCPRPWPHPVATTATSSSTEAGKLHLRARMVGQGAESFPSKARVLRGLDGICFSGTWGGRWWLGPLPPRHLLGQPGGTPSSEGLEAWRQADGSHQLNSSLQCAPANLCHPRDASDQIWAFLHTVIGSQEVLTGLGRRLQEAPGGEGGCAAT